MTITRTHTRFPSGVWFPGGKNDWGERKSPLRAAPNEHKMYVRNPDNINVTFSRIMIFVRNPDFKSFRHFP